MSPLETYHPAAGFSIVEVLFAVFVLSVGLLGVTGLQIVAKQSNFEAVQRATATMLANDIIERIRANTDATARPQYLVSWQPVTASSAPSECTTASACDPSALAARDLWEWKQAILGATDLSADNANTGGLVSPSVCITSTDSGENSFQVAIAWRGKGALAQDADANTCGESVDYGANDEYRRLLVISAFM